MTFTPTAIGYAGQPDQHYDVDPSQVAALAAGLRRVHDAILGLGRLEPTIATDLGAPVVADALHELSRSWSAARGRLGQELDLLARAGQVASHSYATVDGNVLAALAGR